MEMKAVMDLRGKHVRQIPEEMESSKRAKFIPNKKIKKNKKTKNLLQPFFGKQVKRISKVKASQKIHQEILINQYQYKDYKIENMSI